MASWSRRIAGWSAVGVTAAVGSFWAFWGINENFHEGWHHASLWRNLGLMLAQYLSLMLLFVAAGLIGVRWPRIGGIVHVAFAIAAAWFFRSAAPVVIYPFIVLPLTVMGLAYWLGRPRPLRWALAAVVVPPLVTLVACGIEPALRVADRLDDGDRSARRITCPGVDLVWAPAGPGWPDAGVTWAQAKQRCLYLTADGTTLAPTPQNIWRLPTVEEAVRSMHRHGRRCGGVWDSARQRPTYDRTPDKESPLWNTHSQVIYWWTATAISDQQAYIVVYDGQVRPRPKNANWGYLGFRAVKAGGA